MGNFVTLDVKEIHSFNGFKIQSENEYQQINFVGFVDLSISGTGFI